MMRRRWMVLPALLALVVPVAIAGGEYECTKSTQECLDMMAAKYSKHGWVGIELDKTEEGKLIVKRVVSDSPAVKAGFKEGDILLAVEGIEYAEGNKDQLKAVKEKMLPGKTIAYTVSRAGHEKTLKPVLAKVPTEVLAQWVGGHMLEHAKVEIAQN